MIRVNLKSDSRHNYYLIGLTKDDYEEIYRVRHLRLVDQILPEELPIIIIEDHEFTYDQIVMFGTTKDLTEDQARPFVPKIIISEEEIERKHKRQDLINNGVITPYLTIEQEFLNYTCYGYDKPGGHRTPLSGFRCALEQINYPVYALIYRERVDDGAV